MPAQLSPWIFQKTIPVGNTTWEFVFVFVAKNSSWYLKQGLYTNAVVILQHLKTGRLLI